MRRLPVPTTTLSDAYQLSVQAIKEKTNRQPYLDAAEAVVDGCKKYDLLSANQSFHDAESDTFKIVDLPGHEMRELYDNQFSKSKRTRSLRDSIRNAAPHGLCPYCGQGRVAELDHYLPKSSFAATTVYPANLVPACRDCNFAKKAYRPDNDSPPVLHPYFDPAFDVPWLRARIVGQGSIPTAEFFVELSSPDARLVDRVNAHLNVFQLHQRFSNWAAQTLEDFERLVRSAPSDSFSLAWATSHATICAEQHSGGRINSWERATYEAMVHSVWYFPAYLGLS